MCVNVSISVVHSENHHTIPGLTILISKYMYVHCAQFTSNPIPISNLTEVQVPRELRENEL